MNLARTFEAGVEHLQNGRLRDAAMAFLEILRAAPNHPDAHYLLAQTALMAGDLQEAEGRATLAALADPARADIQLLAGNIAQRRGDPARAEARYREALRIDARYAEAQLNLGNALGELGRVDEALAAYDAALELNPGLLPAALNRAALLARSGRRDEALRDIERLQERHPASTEVRYRRARLAQEAGDTDGALALHRAVLELDPEHALAHYDLGVLLSLRGNEKEALAHFERCLRTQPAHREAQLRRARLLADRGRGAEALRALEALRASEPGWTEAQFAYGDVCARLRRDDEAMAAYDAVLALEPVHFGARASRAMIIGRRGDPAAALAQIEALLAEAPGEARLLNGAGVQLYAMGRLQEAEAQYEAAIARDPALLEARGNLAHARLLQGDFARGWRQLGERWRRGGLDRQRRRVSCPLWCGEPLAGKSLFVWPEPDLGDQIMYASQFPELAAQAVSGLRTVFECSARLESLFARSFPGSTVVTGNAVGEARLAGMAFDFHAPMSALCEHLRADWSAFPQHQGYLKADPARRAAWRRRLDALGPGAKIGISWRDGAEGNAAAIHSSSPEDWAALFEVPGARLVNLQAGECRKEIAALSAAGRAIEDWPGVADDFEESAALLCELDLVVSVCTTVVHLAGALGRPVWVLVPARPGWRYLLAGERLPWYPSARLLRQAQPGDWRGVISAAARELSGRTSPG